MYLGVKRVTLQPVVALELPGVSLVHGQSVLSSLKDLGLVNLIKSTPGEVSLSAHCHKGHPLPVSIFTKSRYLLLVGVVVEYQWKPKFLDIFICESIQGIVFFLGYDTSPDSPSIGG